MQLVPISLIFVPKPGAKVGEPSEPFQRQRGEPGQDGGRWVPPFHSYLKNMCVEPCTRRAGRHPKYLEDEEMALGRIRNFIHSTNRYQVLCQRARP